MVRGRTSPFTATTTRRCGADMGHGRAGALPLSHAQARRPPTAPLRALAIGPRAPQPSASEHRVPASYAACGVWAACWPLWLSRVPVLLVCAQLLPWRRRGAARVRHRVEGNLHALGECVWRPPCPPAVCTATSPAPRPRARLALGGVAHRQPQVLARPALRRWRRGAPLSRPPHTLRGPAPPRRRAGYVMRGRSRGWTCPRC